jgi:hypothetical protein
MQNFSTDLRGFLKARIDRASMLQIAHLTGVLATIDEPIEVIGLRQPSSDLLVPDWKVLNEHEALDRTTGLIWLRDYVSGRKRAWKPAIQAASEVQVGGHVWRAPSIREQLSIVEYERRDPAYDNTVLRGGSDAVWTATELKSSGPSSPSGCAWVVYFNYGTSYYYYQGNECFVRAVRSSQ